MAGVGIAAWREERGFPILPTVVAQAVADQIDPVRVVVSPAMCGFRL